MILEKLDTINWHELSHAYGAADDVPQLLRDVASRKGKKRERAYQRLYSTIYHQGTVYQASAYAAPFLIELLKDEHVPARHDIIALLVNLITYKPYLRQHPEASSEGEKQSTEFQEQFVDVERTYQAVREGLDTYLTLLTHRKRRLRMSAVNILGWFKEDEARLVPILSACLQSETNQLIRSCIVFSLGQLVEYGSEQHSRIVLLLTDDTTELVKITAALTLVRMGRDDTPIQAIKVLLRALEEHGTWENVYLKLPWSHRRFVFDVMHRLYDLPPQMNGFVVPQLLQLLTFFDEQKAVNELNDDAALAIAQLLLYLVCRNIKVEEGTTFEDLSREQQQILHAIASTDAIWSWSNNLGKSSSYYYGLEDAERLVEVSSCLAFYELHCLGFPDNRKELREFVQLVPSEQDEIRYVRPSDDLSPKKMFQRIRTLNPQLSREALQYIRDWSC